VPLPYRCPTATRFAANLREGRRDVLDVPSLSAPVVYPTALATQNPEPGTGNYPVAPSPPIVTTVVHHGTALWVFVLVAAVAMCLAISATLALQSVRAHRTERTNSGRTTARQNQSSSCPGG
jgi:hypothetical protein